MLTYTVEAHIAPIIPIPTRTDLSLVIVCTTGEGIPLSSVILY